jgi:hypothetical protein
VCNHALGASRDADPGVVACRSSVAVEVNP